MYPLESWPCAFEYDNVLFTLPFPKLQKGTTFPLCQFTLPFPSTPNTQFKYLLLSKKAFVLPRHTGDKDLLHLFCFTVFNSIILCITLESYCWFTCLYSLKDLAAGNMSSIPVPILNIRVPNNRCVLSKHQIEEIKQLSCIYSLISDTMKVSGR